MDDLLARRCNVLQGEAGDAAQLGAGAFHHHAEVLADGLQGRVAQRLRGAYAQAKALDGEFAIDDGHHDVAGLGKPACSLCVMCNASGPPANWMAGTGLTGLPGGIGAG